MKEEILEEILKRLNVLISLQLDPVYWEKATDQEKIERLLSRGLKTGAIAEILGKSSDKISKQVYVLTKLKKKGGKDEKES